ncbi:MAG: YusW family protein [Bacillota bacterium]
MKKMTVGLAAVILLAGCGTGDETAESDQQAVTDAVNGETSPAEGGMAEQEGSSDEATVEGSTASGMDAESSGIREFDLDLEFKDGQEWEFDFDREGEASIERDDGENLSGQAAQDEFTQLFQAVQFSIDRPLEDIKREVLEAAAAAEADVREYEMDVKFDSGEEIEIDHDTENSGHSDEVDEFNLELEFAGGGEAGYEYESDEREAEIEHRDGSESEDAKALDEMEQLLGQITITMDRSIGEMKAEVLEALAIDAAEVAGFELEISYRGGEEIKFAHEMK